MLTFRTWFSPCSFFLSLGCPPSSVLARTAEGGEDEEEERKFAPKGGRMRKRKKVTRETAS